MSTSGQAGRLGRRDMLGLAAAAACVSPATLWAQAARTTPDGFAVRLCDLTLPATDSPGAVAAGVPGFLPIALQHGLYGATGDDLGHVREALNAGSGGDFMGLLASRQTLVLGRLDHAVFARADAATTPWRRVKSVILAGYYGSEIGGSKEQLYELVPGRYDADIPLAAGARDYSSDWAGVAFR